MQTMKRRFGESNITPYQRSDRMTQYLSQRPDVPEEPAGREVFNQQVQKMMQSSMMDESSNSAFQSDQFESVASILGG